MSDTSVVLHFSMQSECFHIRALHLLSRRNYLRDTFYRIIESCVWSSETQHCFFFHLDIPELEATTMARSNANMFICRLVFLSIISFEMHKKSSLVGFD